MGDFGFYFTLGWEHIIGRNALDHQLFIMALMAIYRLKDWKFLLILVTAFTIGHSVTLLLSTLDLIRFSTAWVEFLIPLSILITAAVNLLFRAHPERLVKRAPLMAAVFGLIHGMGFANTLRSMLSDTDNLFWPLLGFNLGLEAGQIVVVAAILALGYLLVEKLKLKPVYWMVALSVPALLLAGWMCIQRWPG